MYSKILKKGFALTMNATKSHPAAAVLCLLFFIGTTVSLEREAPNWAVYVVPLCFTLAVAVDYWTAGRKWSWLLLPVAIASLFIDYQNPIHFPHTWEEYGSGTFAYFVYENFGVFTSLFLVLLSFVTLLWRKPVGCKDNEGFGRTALDLLGAATSTLLILLLWNVVVIVCLAASLPLSGLISGGAIFIATIILIGIPFLFAPLLFLGLYEDDRPWLGRNSAEFVTNWFITPAVLLDAVIHLFGIFWKPSSYEMHEVVLNGLLWGIFAFYVKAVQPHLVKRPFKWIAAHIELLSIPVLLQMWRYILLRIGEFGLTDARIMAVVCSAVMTGAFLLTLFPKRNLYYKYTVAAALLIPLAVSANFCLQRSREHAEQISATQSFETLGTQLGVLNEDGTLKRQKIQVTTENKALVSEFYDVFNPSFFPGDYDDYLDFVDVLKGERDPKTVSVHLSDTSAVYDTPTTFHTAGFNSIFIAPLYVSEYAMSYSEIVERLIGEIIPPAYSDEEREATEQLFYEKLKRIDAPRPLSEDYVKAHPDLFLRMDFLKTRIIFDYAEIEFRPGDTWYSINPGESGIMGYMTR